MTTAPFAFKFLIGSIVTMLFLSITILLIPLEWINSLLPEPTYTWQDNCTKLCENKLGEERMNFIDNQECETLYAMYGSERTENQWEWDAAIHDKAMNLNCFGFPKYKFE